MSFNHGLKRKKQNNNKTRKQGPSLKCSFKVYLSIYMYKKFF